MADDVKGSYDATRRRAGAEEARRHLVDVAAPLFVAQGYEGTSMRNLADAAGVSVQTLYNTFGSKFGVFGAVMDVVVAGDHEPEALADRAPLRDLLELDDPASVLAALVDAATEVLVRLAPIFPTLRAAAASDPQVAAAHRQFVLDARHADLRVGVDRLAELDALADGTDPDAATDATWAVLSPDLFHLLVTERGWSPVAFATWATATLTATLLAAPG